MGRMIDLIKQAAIPANVMRSAAKGALSLAPGEMVEILVYLAGHPIFGNEATGRKLNASIPDSSSAAASSDVPIGLRINGAEMLMFYRGQPPSGIQSKFLTLALILIPFF